MTVQEQKIKDKEMKLIGKCGDCKFWVKVFSDVNSIEECRKHNWSTDAYYFLEYIKGCWSYEPRNKK